MKIFLDTADTEVISKHFATGLIDGITTNPSLIRKSGRDPEDVYQELIDLGVKDISMEVVGNGIEMAREGERLFKKFGEIIISMKIFAYLIHIEKVFCLLFIIQSQQMGEYIFTLPGQTRC